ncbi:MAG: baseplate J/gp47 family protein [Nitrospira sp.]|nr:baseplate J/gp47 family protein [Nitrospira sp.]
MSDPTLTELRDAFVAEVESELATDIPLLPVAVTRVLGAMYAAGVTMIRKLGNWNLLQQFAEFAEFNEVTVNGKAIRPLVALGNSWGVPPPYGASRAVQTIELTVTTQSGSIPANTRLSFTGNSFVYVTRSSVTLNASTVQVTIESISGPNNGLGTGAASTIPIGSKIQFISAQENVARDAVVVATISAGEDAESERSYRKRVLDKRRRPPQGGAHADYFHWALENQGIVAAYPYNSYPGRIDVYIEASEESSGSADGIPTSGQIAAVQAYIDQPTRKPANDGVTVKAITRTGFDVTVNGLVVENASVVEARIEEALDQHFRTREPYIDGLSTPPRSDLITQPTVSAVVLDVVQAYAGYVFSINTVAYQKLEYGEKAKLGTITFVA